MQTVVLGCEVVVTGVRLVLGVLIQHSGYMEFKQRTRPP